MPKPDPVPSIGPLKVRFIRVMRWGGLFSVTIAIMAVVLAARGESVPQIHILIATALGVGLSVLLGAALMTLIFLINSSGFHAEAADHKDKNPQ